MPAADTLVLATRNAAKLRELARILAARVSVTGLDSFPGAPDVPETRATFEANALLKARAIAQHTNLPVVADDSGLCVDALGGMPGVLSARWAGGHGDDKANLDLVLAQVSDVPDPRLGARFVCAAALVVPGPVPREVVVTGRVEGRLVRTPRGTGGFGYDPIFLPDGFGQTTAEMTAEEKDAISHRGRAFRALVPFITALSLLPFRHRSPLTLRPGRRTTVVGTGTERGGRHVVSYEGRRFRPEGETGPVVTYRQDGDLLWAEIPSGGGVRRGCLAGRCASDGVLDFAYCMVLDDGEVVSGRCHSTPMRRRGGGLRIREEWERYGPNAATGVSYLEEVEPPPGPGTAPGRPAR